TVAAATGGGLAKQDAASRTANWLLQDIKHLFAKAGIEPQEIASSRLTSARLASLVVLAGTGKITGKNAKQCLEAVLAEDKDPQDIARERGWEVISDPAAIAEVLKSVAAGEEALVQELKGGELSEKRRQALTAFLTGKVLAATGGKADPKIAGRLVSELLKG
ncbi:MAG: Asp-tRNA(Asn)/Glu-tRNA(Gln) amidotransferase GatCAB subunit B, partial [Spirochaetes bacterium]|nr:Asp-tRNA(Asn)/Glu-tRNA(Gln) amidotransferase GatCAB subunit B [Spirochaetota bacterium]